MKIFQCGLIVLGLALQAALAHASDGQLDPTFGAGGKVYLGWDTDAGVSAQDVAVAVLAPSDGSVVLVGNATDAGSIYKGVNAIGIAKLTPSGTFDSRFGSVTTPGQTKLHGAGNFPYSARITANAAVLQADGKIVIAGNTYFPAQGRSLATVWRLNADGSPDTAFGTNGSTSIDRNQIDQFDNAIGLTIVHGVSGTTYDALEGRIVVAGSYDFDPSLVVASSWIFELNPDGTLVNNAVDGDGQNTFEWPSADCADGGSYYHDQTFTAIRFLYIPDTDTLRYFVAGNCVPRHGLALPLVPYIAAIDSKLNLVTAFGNSGGGFSQITFVDNAHSYPNSYVTSLDINADGSTIVFAGYHVAADGRTQIFRGGLDASGRLQSSWANGGAMAMPLGSVGSAARAILIRPNHGRYLNGAEDILAGRFDDGQCPPDFVCGLEGAHFLAIADYLGAMAPYCVASTPTICHYEFAGSSDQGAYAISLTQGDKILLAGYTTFASDGRTDFAVMRLQGDGIFFNGFGGPVQDFQ